VAQGVVQQAEADHDYHQNLAPDQVALAEKQVQKHQPQAEELLQVHLPAEKHLLLQHKSHK
jgi:hypothetical protein